MELNYDQIMTANVPAVDHDNAPVIEVGDVLYGVTMEQRGVSKLVSVVLN